MRLFNKVAIVGVGLIGGSIALGLKKRKLAQEIIGVSRHKNTLLLAKNSGAIDKGSQQLGIVKDADLVIFATPVNTILNLANTVSKTIRKECIVTDVGSTKAKIVSKLSRIFPNYVGSHPLAGSERRGISNASPDIFKKSLCILTPVKSTNTQALEKIKKLWLELGTNIVLLDPDTHDKMFSFVSHLPHVLAFSLIGIIPSRYLKLATNSLRDTTRIAASDSRLWQDIFLTNRSNMLKAIDIFKENLSRIRSAIKSKDKKLLNKILKEANKKRQSIG